MTEWSNIPDTQASPRQRQGLYRWLIYDQDRVKDLIRLATVEQADRLLRLLAEIKQNAEPRPQATDGWEAI